MIDISVTMAQKQSKNYMMIDNLINELCAFNFDAHTNSRVDRDHFNSSTKKTNYMFFFWFMCLIDRSKTHAPRSCLLFRI